MHNIPEDLKPFFQELIDSNKLSADQIIHLTQDCFKALQDEAIRSFLKELIDLKKLSADLMLYFIQECFDALQDERIRSFLKELIDSDKFSINQMIILAQIDFKALQNEAIRSFLKELIDSDKLSADQAIYLHPICFEALQNEAIRSFLKELIDSNKLSTGRMLYFTQECFDALQDERIRNFLKELIDSGKLSADQMTHLTESCFKALQNEAIRSFLKELIDLEKLSANQMTQLTDDWLKALQNEAIRSFLKELIDLKKLSVYQITHLTESCFKALQNEATRSFLKELVDSDKFPAYKITEFKPDTYQCLRNPETRSRIAFLAKYAAKPLSLDIFELSEESKAIIKYCKDYLERGVTETEPLTKQDILFALESVVEAPNTCYFEQRNGSILAVKTLILARNPVFKFIFTPEKFSPKNSIEHFWPYKNILEAHQSLLTHSDTLQLINTLNTAFKKANLTEDNFLILLLPLYFEKNSLMSIETELLDYLSFLIFILENNEGELFHKIILPEYPSLLNAPHTSIKALKPWKTLKEEIEESLKITQTTEEYPSSAEILAQFISSNSKPFIKIMDIEIDFRNEMELYEKTIKPFNDKHQDFSLSQERLIKSEIQNLSKKIKDSGYTPSINQQAQLLALLSELHFYHYGFAPSGIQLFNIILLTQNKDILSEIKTGEGKSTIIRLRAAFKRLCSGRKQYILESTDMLSQRDFEKSAPFFQEVGLSAICNKDKRYLDPKTYEADILYTVASKIQHSMITASRGGRETLQDALTDEALKRVDFISDEVDATTLDAHTIPSVVSSTRDNTEVPSKKYLEDMWRFALGPFSQDIHTFRAYLIQKNYAQASDFQPTEGEEDSGIQKQNRKDALMKSYQRYLAIMAAKRSDENVDYTIIDEEIVIVNPETGELLPHLIMSNIQQQLLEFKHDLPITQPLSESMLAFTRGHLFSKAGAFCGVTGSIGTEHDIDNLSALVGTEKLNVYSSPRLHKYKGTECPPKLFKKDSEKWAYLIQGLKENQNKSRPSLIITESIAEAESLAKKLSEITELSEKIQLFTGKEKDPENIIVRAGLPRKITISTAIAGRGVDIRCINAEENGGLKVYMTTPPANDRVKTQVSGRAARMGQPGEFELVLCYNDIARKFIEQTEKHQSLSNLSSQSSVSSDTQRSETASSPLNYTRIEEPLTLSQKDEPPLNTLFTQSNSNKHSTLNRKIEALRHRFKTTEALFLAYNHLQKSTFSKKQHEKDQKYLKFTRPIEAMYELLKYNSKTFCSNRWAKIQTYLTHLVDLHSDDFPKFQEELITGLSEYYDDLPYWKALAIQTNNSRIITLLSDISLPDAPEKVENIIQQGTDNLVRIKNRFEPPASARTTLAITTGANWITITSSGKAAAGWAEAKGDDTDNGTYP